jgi:hypothetical protein
VRRCVWAGEVVQGDPIAAAEDQHQRLEHHVVKDRPQRADAISASPQRGDVGVGGGAILLDLGHGHRHATGLAAPRNARASRAWSILALALATARLAASSAAF